MSALVKLRQTAPGLYRVDGALGDRLGDRFGVLRRTRRAGEPGYRRTDTYYVVFDGAVELGSPGKLSKAAKLIADTLGLKPEPVVRLGKFEDDVAVATMDGKPFAEVTREWTEEFKHASSYAKVRRVSYYTVELRSDNDAEEIRTFTPDTLPEVREVLARLARQVRQESTP